MTDPEEQDMATYNRTPGLLDSSKSQGRDSASVSYQQEPLLQLQAPPQSDAFRMPDSAKQGQQEQSSSKIETGEDKQILEAILQELRAMNQHLRSAL